MKLTPDHFVSLGTSDPYLKCIHGQDKLFQTRAITKTVNPIWDEIFDSYIDNPFKPITLQVIVLPSRLFNHLPSHPFILP